MEDFVHNNRYKIQVFSLGAYFLIVFGYFYLAPSEAALFNFINIFVSISVFMATVAAYLASRFSTQSKEYQNIWGWMLFGLISWSIAEVLSLFVVANLGDRSPASGIISLFLGFGYFPLSIALLLHYQNANKSASPDSSTIVLVFSLMTVLLLGIALVALFNPFKIDPAQLTRILTNTFFVIANLSILICALISLQPQIRGPLSTIWGLIAITFVVRALIDITHIVLAWNGPMLGRFASLPTIIITSTNLLLTANIYIGWILDQQAGLDTKLKLGFIGETRELPQFLMITDSKGVIVFISENFLQFTNNSLAERFIGKPAQEIIGLSPQEFDTITNTCSHGGFIVQQDIKVAAGHKSPVPLFLTAVGSVTGREFFGLDMVLHLPNYIEYAFPLDAESHAIVQGIMQRTGQQNKENSSLLVEYFIAHVRAFKELLNSSLNRPMTVSMDQEVNSTALKNKWPIRLSGLEVKVEPGFDNFDTAELIKSLPLLYKIARQYTTDLTSIEAVALEIRNVDKNINPKVLQAAQKYGLRAR